MLNILISFIKTIIQIDFNFPAGCDLHCVKMHGKLTECFADFHSVLYYRGNVKLCNNHMRKTWRDFIPNILQIDARICSFMLLLIYLHLGGHWYHDHDPIPQQLPIQVPSHDQCCSTLVYRYLLVVWELVAKH